MVNPILCLPIHDGNWLFEVCFQCLHRCHYLRMGAEQYFRLVSQTQRPERPDKQQRVDSDCHWNRSRAVHNCTVLEESTEVGCETRWLCQSPRVGSIAIIGTKVLREGSDAPARRGAASLPKEPSVRVPPKKVVSIARPIGHPVRRVKAPSGYPGFRQRLQILAGHTHTSTLERRAPGLLGLGRELSGMTRPSL